VVIHTVPQTTDTPHLPDIGPLLADIFASSIRLSFTEAVVSNLKLKINKRTWGVVLVGILSSLSLSSLARAEYIGESGILKGKIEDWDKTLKGQIQVIADDLKATVLASADVAEDGLFSLELPNKANNLLNQIQKSFASDQGCIGQGGATPSKASWASYHLELKMDDKPQGDVVQRSSSQMWKQNQIATELLYFNEAVTLNGLHSCPTSSNVWDNVRVSKGWNLLPYRWVHNDQGLEERQYSLLLPSKDLKWFWKEQYGIVGMSLEAVKDGRGAKVTAVAKDSPADKAGIQIGDVIYQADGQVVNQQIFVNLIRLIRGEPSSLLRLTLERNGRDQFLRLNRGLGEFR
jgi:hypothetical protein